MFNFLWNKSDFDEAIQLMQQGKYSEAKAAFSTVSSKDKDYPRAKFNLFSLCCSGFLNGRFYIDEGVKHLKEAYTYKHPVADIFFPVIEYVKKGDCGLKPIQQIIEIRYTSQEIKEYAKAGCPDPYITTFLCLWCYHSSDFYKCSGEFFDYYETMEEYLSASIDDIAEYILHNQLNYDTVVSAFMHFIFNPIKDSYQKFNPEYNSSFQVNSKVIELLFSYFYMLMVNLQLSSSKKITLLYSRLVFMYKMNKDLKAIEDCSFELKELASLMNNK